MASELLQHCPWCGYSLEGLPNDHRCPECGQPFNREWKLFYCGGLLERRTPAFSRRKRWIKEIINWGFFLILLSLLNRVPGLLEKIWGRPINSSVYLWFTVIILIIVILYFLKRRPTFVGVSPEELAIGNRSGKSLLRGPMAEVVSAELRPALVLQMNGQELWFEPGKRSQMKECVQLINKYIAQSRENSTK